MWCRLSPRERSPWDARRWRQRGLAPQSATSSTKSSYPVHARLQLRAFAGSVVTAMVWVVPEFDLERRHRGRRRSPRYAPNVKRTRCAVAVGAALNFTVYFPALTSETDSVPADCGALDGHAERVFEGLTEFDRHPRGALVLLAGYGRVVLSVGYVEATAVPDDVQLTGRAPRRQRVASDDVCLQRMPGQIAHGLLGLDVVEDLSGVPLARWGRWPCRCWRRC